MENQVTESNMESVQQQKNAKKATVGFILGLCSIIAWLIPLFGFPVTIVGLVFSILGIKSTKKNLAIVGIVLTVLFLIVTIVNTVIGVMYGIQNASKILSK